MPAGAVASQQAPASPGKQGGALPFLLGSNQYREAPFIVFGPTQLGASSVEFVANITPGGFLRGVTLQVTSTGGVLGPGVLGNDSPTSIIQSVSLEDISGGPVLYPMSGFAYLVVQKYLRPWAGDITKRSDFSNTINPAFTLRLFAEVVGTLGVLANTDARAQYRLRLTLSPGNAAGQFNLTTTAPTTQPTVSINVYLETWAQPDLNDLLGNPISQIPDGLAASRFNMHEIPSITSGGNVVRATLTGNELRGLAFIVRDGVANKTRVNLTDTNAGAIDVRMDNRRLWKMKPSQWVEEMQAFYPFLGAGTWTRETGVFVYPRFTGGDVLAGGGLVGEGDSWLQTVEQTLIQLEFNGGDVTTSPGTMEIIYDALAVAGQIPHELEGV